MRRQHWTVLGGLLLSGAAVYYFVSRMTDHWGDFAHAFARADYVHVLPALGMLALSYTLRIVRWRYFLRPAHEVPVSHVASATLIGFMSSNVLPLRPGEVIRPYLLHRKSGIPFGHAAGTGIVLERLFDLVGAGMLLLLAIVTTPSAIEKAADGSGSDILGAIRDQSIWLAGITGIALAGLLTVVFRPQWALRLGRLLTTPLPDSWRNPLQGFFENATRSLGFLRSGWRVLVALGLTAAVWMCFPLLAWWLERAFALGLGFRGALLVQVFVTAAVVAPQAPGFLGLFHAAAMAGAELFGVPSGKAGAFAMALWAVNILPVTAVGLALLWYEGLDLRNLAASSKERSKADNAVDAG